MLIDETILARYPFLPEAKEYVRSLAITLNDLDSPLYIRSVERAEEKIKNSLKLIHSVPDTYTVEILSYVIANIIIGAINNHILTQKYIFNEAEKYKENLVADKDELLFKIAEDYGWDLQFQKNYFTLHFIDYLTASKKLKDKHWKLINRILSHGYVYLKRDHVVRLLIERIKETLELRTRKKPEQLPQNLIKRIGVLKKWVDEKLASPLIQATKHLNVQHLPPCINRIYFKTSNLSHIERFTLTSFLANIGVPPEKISEIFKTQPDYSAVKTEYQIQHIIKKRYKSPKCKTLVTHHLCFPDKECKNLNHPLTYYNRKRFKRKVPYSK